MCLKGWGEIPTICIKEIPSDYSEGIFHCKVLFIGHTV